MSQYNHASHLRKMKKMRQHRQIKKMRQHRHHNLRTNLLKGTGRQPRIQEITLIVSTHICGPQLKIRHSSATPKRK